jgi:succinyl-CoA synthetase beta subunit
MYRRRNERAASVELQSAERQMIAQYFIYHLSHVQVFRKSSTKANSRKGKIKFNVKSQCQTKKRGKVSCPRISKKNIGTLEVNGVIVVMNGVQFI